jgi:hypothetical protein
MNCLWSASTGVTDSCDAEQNIQTLSCAPSLGEDLDLTGDDIENEPPSTGGAAIFHTEGVTLTVTMIVVRLMGFRFSCTCIEVDREDDHFVLVVQSFPNLPAGF